MLLGKCYIPVLFVSVRYKDYRDPPWAPEAYTYSKQYWSMLAAKLAFVIFFQVRKICANLLNICHLTQLGSPNIRKLFI